MFANLPIYAVEVIVIGRKLSTGNMLARQPPPNIATYISRRFKMDDYIVEKLDFDEIVVLE